jgi:hypothetical protein
VEFGRSSAVSNRWAASVSASAPPRVSVSSTSGAIAKSGAIDARAATVIDAAGAARRTSAIAGNAITASPSQFGARMTRRFMYGTVKLSMINTDPLLSVVMPGYSERTTIEAIVRRLLALTLRLELIVVDDGSQSRMRAAAPSRARRSPGLPASWRCGCC